MSEPINHLSRTTYQTLQDTQGSQDNSISSPAKEKTNKVASLILSNSNTSLILSNSNIRTREKLTKRIKRFFFGAKRVNRKKVSKKIKKQLEKIKKNNQKLGISTTYDHLRNGLNQWFNDGYHSEEKEFFQNLNNEELSTFCSEIKPKNLPRTLSSSSLSNKLTALSSTYKKEALEKAKTNIKGKINLIKKDKKLDRTSKLNQILNDPEVKFALNLLKENSSKDEYDNKLFDFCFESGLLEIFTDSEFSSENVHFLYAMNELDDLKSINPETNLKEDSEESLKKYTKIKAQFIEETSVNLINISSGNSSLIISDKHNANSSTLDAAKSEITSLLKKDTFPRLKAKLFPD